MIEPSRSPGSDVIPTPTAPHRVAARGKGHSLRGGRRGRVVNEIHQAARERQGAWLETAQPNRTFQLTCELEGLYGDHRDDQAGTFSDPFYGRTSAVRS